MAGAEVSIRFYCDADVIGLAKVLQVVRADVTYPGDPGGLAINRRQRPACGVDPTTPDEEWLPFVASRGWLVLSRDRHIESRPTEIVAVTSSGAKLVVIDSRGRQLTKFEQLEIVMSQWRRIESLHEVPGPFVYRASRTGFGKVI